VTGLAVDGDVLDRLDFEPVVPCDADGHAESLAGCESDAPGRWVVLVMHYAPGCKPLPQVLCDPQLQSTTRTLAELLSRPMTPGAMLLAAICSTCGAPLTRVEDLIVVIREL